MKSFKVLINVASTEINPTIEKITENHKRYEQRFGKASARLSGPHNDRRVLLDAIKSLRSINKGLLLSLSDTEAQVTQLTVLVNEASAKSNPLCCPHCGEMGIDTDVGYTMRCDCESEASNTEPKSTNLYRDALDLWGHDAQIKMMIEECGELITSLAHWYRGRHTNIATEIADVQIMTEQLAIIFGQEDVENEKLRKLSRLRQRIESYSVS